MMNEELLFSIFQGTSVFLFGLVFGSFLNVVIHRLPKNESLIRPRSQCPSCQTPINAFDNIPIISFIILRGRCRSCRARISPRYPLVELLTGLLLLALYLRFGLSIAFFPMAVFILALIAISFIDIDLQIIPDKINFSMIFFALTVALIDDLIPGLDFWPVSILQSFIGLLVGLGTLMGIIYGYLLLTKKEGMGGGDLKMLAMIGAFLGWKKVLLTLFLSCFIGSFFSIPLLLFQNKDGSSKITFGPFLALGALVALFYGDFLISSYINLFEP